MDPVRRSPAARPPSGVCCRSDDTQLSVPPRFTDGNGVAHSRLSDVPGEGAAVMPRCSWAGGQKSSYNARHAGVAQLVERRLPKPEVASSRLVARSTFHHRRHHRGGGHGVQAHGQHPKLRSRRHPGRFPAAAARAFQRQAPVSSPPVFWQRPHEARHHVSPPSCAGRFRCLSRPRNTGRICITSEACAASESPSKPGQAHEACSAHVLPANERSRRCPHTTGLRRDPVPSRFLVRLQPVTPDGVIFHQLEPHCVEHGKGGCQGQAQDPGEIPHGRCPYR